MNHFFEVEVPRRLAAAELAGTLLFDPTDGDRRRVDFTRSERSDLRVCEESDITAQVARAIDVNRGNLEAVLERTIDPELRNANWPTRPTTATTWRSR